MAKPGDPARSVKAPLPIATLSAPERLACLRLIRSENVGPVAFRELINRFGGAAQALAALPELVRRGGGRSIRVHPEEAAAAELAAAERIGAEPIFTIEPNYPRLLAHIEAPPPLVYVMGKATLLNRRAIAIVGSRQCSAAGSELARLFATRLGEAGFVIVSGLARGIDRAAHEAALAAGTVAVLAGGLDRLYPPEHERLAAEIAERGCLITDRPPGFTARAQDFPRRNRIIAGLVEAVLVVEAAARSGTLVTARYAAEHGREVFALPGHPLDPRAEGTNNLLKQGATLITAAEEIVAHLRPIHGLDEHWPDQGARMAPGPARDWPEAHASTSAHGLGPPAAEPDTVRPDAGASVSEDGNGAGIHAVLSTLGPAPATLDSIVRATGLPIQAVQAAILELDLAGYIERQGQGLVALRRVPLSD